MARSLAKTLSVLLAIALALSLVPAPALAEAAEEAMGEEPASAQTKAGHDATADEGLSASDAELAPMTEEGTDTEPTATEELTAEDAAPRDELEAGEAPAEEGGEIAEDPELSTQAVIVRNPRIVASSGMESGQVVNWDCVWLGSYPQTEVAETDALRNASWYGGDATVGGVRYRRISRSDTTSAKYWAKNAGTYRYFRYEPIKWRVLKVSGGTALVVADVALDCRSYHTSEFNVAWDTSSVRSWLNATGTAPYYSSGAQSGRTAQGFATVAFTADQLGAVRRSSIANASSLYYDTPGVGNTTDRVFLLSESEAYGSSATAHGFSSNYDAKDEARRCKATDFTCAMGATMSSTYAGICYWWLRSPGSSANHPVDVYHSGRVYRYGTNASDSHNAVRPAMYIDLSSSQLRWAGTACSNGTANEGAAPRTFSDVPADAWYANVVTRAVALGLLSGYEDGRFGPNDPITRGQVAVVLWNMAGRPGAGAGAKSFPDVKSGDYHYNAVRWASSKGVVSGYADGKFGPNDRVTREQLAAMLANYAKRVAGKQVTGSVSDFSSMKDKAKVSSWAVPSVGWCFRNSILSGSNGKVDPQGNATRAEAAKMVVYLHDLVS